MMKHPGGGRAMVVVVVPSSLPELSAVSAWREEVRSSK